jgi:hypothetical protein
MQTVKSQKKNVPTPSVEISRAMLPGYQMKAVIKGVLPPLCGEDKGGEIGCVSK